MRTIPYEVIFCALFVGVVGYVLKPNRNAFFNVINTGFFCTHSLTFATRKAREKLTKIG